MKKHYFLICLFLFPLLAYSQAGEWTWMKGDAGSNSPPDFGVMGVPSPTNNPPGIYAPGFWNDTAGNLWVYGGYAYSDFLGDEEIGTMWQFNPNTMNWTWMSGDTTESTAAVYAAGSGVFSSANDPGALGFGIATWTDKQSHLWMLGGSLAEGNYSDDLWQYDPSINQWAWMSGSQGITASPNYGTKGIESPTNTPGSRVEGNCTWVDTAGNLWLFGGPAGQFGYNRNDMWKYDVATGLWVWMSGSNNYNNPGVYGPIGVPSPNYYPSVRGNNFHWQDSQGNFWLIGGGNLVNENTYNDVWKFNPVTLDWTLMKGSANNETANISSGNCLADSNNAQGGRYENRAVWKVCDGVVINYSGYKGFWPDNQHSDLWAFLPENDEWVEINEYGTAGSYGTQDSASPQNYPPVRIGSCSLLDRQNNLWLFGGLDETEGLYNDLWKYVPDTSCISSAYCRPVCNLAAPQLVSDKDTICQNDSAQICAPSGFTSYLWSNGNTVSCISVYDTGTYYVNVTNSSGCTAQSASKSIIVVPPPTVNISATPDTICPGDSSQICAQQSFAAYAWSPAPAGGAGACIEARTTGSYYVNVTDNNGCTARSNPVGINVLPPPTATITASPTAICPDDSARICAPQGLAGYAWNSASGGASSRCIEAQNAGDYYVTITDNSGCTAESNHVGITALQAPPVSISRSGDTLIVYNATSVQWYLNDSLIQGATQSTYIARTAGSYTVGVTDSDGCTSFSSAILYTGIFDISADDNIFIYPNPLSVGSWQLAVSNKYIDAQLEILAADGRVVYQSEITHTHSEIQAPFAGGVYLLRITSGTGVVVRKLVKL